MNADLGYGRGSLKFDFDEDRFSVVNYRAPTAKRR